MTTREHEVEPVPGLPERPPEGEGILWQGAPNRWSFAVRAMRLRGVGLYLAAMVAWRVASEGTVSSLWWPLGLALACLGILGWIGWMQGASALYTITTKRVVFRVGVALPMTVNIPFALVQDALVRRHRDGTEDLVLTLLPGSRASFVALWPHVRPWRVSRPEPMLRAVPASAGAAQVLARALAAHAGQPVSVPAAEPAREPAAEPVAA